MKRAQADRIDAALDVTAWIIGAAISAGTVVWARAFRDALRQGRNGRTRPR